MSSSFAKHEKVEDLIALLLRWGIRTVWIALLLAYLVNFLKGQSFITKTDLTDLLNGSRSISSPPPRHIGEVITGLSQGDSSLFIQFGLLILILLPGMRVALLLGHFLRKRNWLWIAISSFVLTSMLFGTIVRLIGE